MRPFPFRFQRILLGLFVPISLLVFSCGHGTPSPSLSLQLTQSTHVANSGSLTFRLVNEASGNESICEDSLNIDHEKKLHVLVFDEALLEYRHEHPTCAGGLWTLPINLSVNGSYRIYAQGSLSQGNTAFTVDSQLTVFAGNAANPAPPVLSDTLVAEDGLSRVTLTGPFVSGSTQQVPISFSRTDSSQPSLGLYLGEYIHAIFVPLAGTPLIHVHGMLSGGQFHLMLNLPAPGQYRGWIQFKDAGVVKTAAVAITAS